MVRLFRLTFSIEAEELTLVSLLQNRASFWKLGRYQVRLRRFECPGASIEFSPPFRSGAFSSQVWPSRPPLPRVLTLLL